MGQLVHDDELFAVYHQGHDDLTVFFRPQMILNCFHNLAQLLVVGFSELAKHLDTKVPEFHIQFIFEFYLVYLFAKLVNLGLLILINYILLVLSDPKNCMDYLGDMLEWLSI